MRGLGMIERNRGPARGLPESRDSGRGEEPKVLPSFVRSNDKRHFGSRPDDDISPRITLINCGNSSSDVRRKIRPTRVTRASPFPDGLRASTARTRRHRAQLIHREQPPKTADALLAKEYRTSIFDENRKHRQRKNRHRNDQRNTRNNDIRIAT